MAWSLPDRAPPRAYSNFKKVRKDPLNRTGRGEARLRSMTDVEAAIERLERAVARIEAARGVGGSGSEVDNAQLKEIVGEIAERVDQALTRIGRVLGEGG